MFGEMMSEKIIKLDELITDIKECDYIDCHRDDICHDTTYESILFYLEQVNKLQKIERYLDNHKEIPIEVVINIKNIIYEESDKV